MFCIRIAPIALVVLLSGSASLGSGCSWARGIDREPFAPTSDHSDFVFVRTGDHRYYYVVDTRRALCFFHARMYGKKHMEQINCQDLPEYEEIVREHRAASAHEAPHEHPHVDEAPPDTVQPEERRAAAEPAGTAQAFKRAWVQRFCAERAGFKEPLPVLLSRHGLDEKSWESRLAGLTAEEKAKLTSEANNACPEGS